MNFRIYILFTILVMLWCVGIVVAPALKQINNETAQGLYSFYSKVCHQQGEHSFHLGNEKFGVCMRCTSIYFGFCLSLLLMPLFGALKRNKITDKKFLTIILMPMLIDIVLNFLNISSSTVETRILSGLLFGLASPWFILPLIISAISKIIENKNLKELGVTNYVRET